MLLETAAIGFGIFTGITFAISLFVGISAGYYQSFMKENEKTKTSPKSPNSSGPDLLAPAMSPGSAGNDAAILLIPVAGAAAGYLLGEAIGKKLHKAIEKLPSNYNQKNIAKIIVAFPILCIAAPFSPLTNFLLDTSIGKKALQRFHGAFEKQHISDNKNATEVSKDLSLSSS